MIAKDELKLKKGMLLTTLPSMNEKFELKFEVKVLKLQSQQWANAVHLSVGNNIGTHGDRIPSIFLNKDSYWHICSSIGSNKNHCHNFQSVSFKNWTSFRIWQDQLPDGDYMYEYAINDVTMYSIQNRNPRKFKNIKVYASDPWYAAVMGSIRNLELCI